eukprot:750227-Hanusia_phi.AAC.4
MAPQQRRLARRPAARAARPKLAAAACPPAGHAAGALPDASGSSSDSGGAVSRCLGTSEHFDVRTLITVRSQRAARNAQDNQHTHTHTKQRGQCRP